MMQKDVFEIRWWKWVVGWKFKNGIIMYAQYPFCMLIKTM